MNEIKFHILQPGDTHHFSLIANWYFSEWKIPIEKTMDRLGNITRDHSQFQVLMTMDEQPIGTAGLYHHVSLLDKEPRFTIYKNWLALVYTLPEKRKKGLGALLCRFIQEHAREKGIDRMYLYTDTAEPLYKRLGWTELERLTMDQRTIVVMTRQVNGEPNAIVRG